METPDQVVFDSFNHKVCWREGEKDVEYDTLTGEKHYIDYKPSGHVEVVTAHQIGDLHDYCQKLRNERNQPIKETFQRYARLSTYTLYQMRKAGIDIGRDTKAMIQFVNKNAPNEKVTNRWHDDYRAKKHGTKIVVK
jgi:hypothetical protein